MCHFQHQQKIRSENIGKLKRSNKFSLEIPPLGLCPEVCSKAALHIHSKR
jgi:hypothetical protein